MPPNKRKNELDNCDEENSKKSKTECSPKPLESPGQENIEETHLADETLADTTSEKVKEVDEDQVQWNYDNPLSMRFSSILCIKFPLNSSSILPAWERGEINYISFFVWDLIIGEFSRLIHWDL